MVVAIRNIARVVFGWTPEDEELYDTAWLNGMRGAAAFLVMMAHFTMAWLSNFADAPFGATVSSNRDPDGIWYFKEGDRLWAPWRLPILRVLMCNGGGQVAIFFVVSGFSLTWSPLGMIQAGDRYEKLWQSLGSSTFRRWLRLYLPCAIVTVAYLIEDIIKRFDERGPISILEKSWGYLGMVEQWANPFRFVFDREIQPLYRYNIVLWTIPYEFGGSIFVYVLLLSFGRFRSFTRRFSAIILITLYALFSLSWALWLFGCGMALADYTRSSGGFKKLPLSTGVVGTVAWCSCLAFGLFLMSFMPDSGWFTRPGFSWMDYLPMPIGWRDTVGEERFWWGWGGILVVLASAHLGFMRRFFETALLQHLGKLSFMLYLVHFLVERLISTPIKDVLYAAICKKEYDEAFDAEVYRTSAPINIGIFIVLLLVSITVAMILAHVLEVSVDRQVIACGKWLDKKLQEGSDKREMLPPNEEEEQLLGTEPGSSDAFELK